MMSPSRAPQTYEGEEVTVTFDPPDNASAGEVVADRDGRRGRPLPMRGPANPPFCDGSHLRIGFGRP